MDINCDMGEGFGAWSIGYDTLIMPHITSANIACGGHAGDPNHMAATVRLAKAHGVAVGAHPGYPDIAGFGRRAFPMTGEEITASVLAQIGALWAIARAYGVEISHVKPHGALYNRACEDEGIARPVCRAVRLFSPTLPIFGLPASVLQQECEESGLQFVPEGFADRAYESNGQLTNRGTPGAVLSDPAEAAKQAVNLARGSVRSRDGTTLRLAVKTICIHGDTPGAPAVVAAVRSALIAAGVEPRRVSRGPSE